MYKFLALLSMTVVSAFGTTSIVGVSTTNTQALIHINTDQVGACTVKVSESAPLTALVHDVDPTLFAGSDQDTRLGTIGSGAADRFFLAGTRTVAKGADGKWYSRALAANTLHYGGATCGSDSQVTFTFTTANIPTGNTYTENVPFDSSATGNYAIPTLRTGIPVIDPRTGLKYSRVSNPGQHTIQAWPLVTQDGGAAVNGAVVQSNNWVNPNNILSLSDAGASATYTTVGQDILAVRLASTSGPGGEGGYSNWQGTQAWHHLSVDSIKVTVTGSTTTPVDVALTWNGVNPASEWKTLSLTSSPSTISYPADHTQMLDPWRGTTVYDLPGIVFQIEQMPIPVNTSGSTVTSSGWPSFPLDTRVFTAGSKLTLNGAEYTVTNVVSNTQLTVTPAPGTQSGTAYVANFGVMFRKHAATSGTVSLDGLSAEMALSTGTTMGGSGFQRWCSSLTATDSGGKIGRFCAFPDSLEGSLYWITDDLQSRFIGRTHAPASSIGVPADEYYQTAYSNIQSMFDTTDPNSWYFTATLVSGGSTLVKATYHPEGIVGCGYSANFQAIPRDPFWSKDNYDNCHITYTELTRPSQSKSLRSYMDATMLAWLGDPVLAFVQNGVAVLTANHGQDHATTFTTVNVADGNKIGFYTNFMNSGENSCRFCTVHGVGPNTSTDNYFYIIHNDFAGGTDDGGGAWNVQVNTPLTTTPQYTPAQCATLISGSTVASYAPTYISGCDTVQLAALDNIPCDPDPSPWETTNLPNCSWHSGWRQFHGGAIKVGDRVIDYAVGAEEMVFAKDLGGGQWILLRTVESPHGFNMQPTPGINPGYLRNHSAGWTANFKCVYESNAIVSLTETDGSGILHDWSLHGFPHAVLRHDGMALASGDGMAVKKGQYTAMLNQPVDEFIHNNVTFAGKQGIGLTQGYGQSHAAWRTGDTSLTDFSPMAPPGGGNFSLWSQPGVINVTGSLYKIPVANAFITPDKRRRAQAVWSGMYNFQDVSGTGSISGSSSDNFKYCSIDYAGATCGQAGESVGDVFLNVPSASVDGQSGGFYDINRINSITLGQETIGAIQYFLGGTGSTDGRLERRLGTFSGHYNGQDTYSNAQIIEGSNILLTVCSGELDRFEDVCVAAMPPKPGAEAGNDFIQMPVSVSAATYAEIQFGYAENGDPNSFFCTTRQEACNTSSPGGTPFNWEGETRSLKSCSSGCSINVPVLPDHAVYYRVRTSSNGTTWSNGPLLAMIAPMPSPANCSDLAMVPTTHSSPSAGDSGSITVTVTDQTCPWTASSGAGWLSITSGASGTGNGTINWTAAANVGISRNANITIAAGPNPTFTDTQADGCSLSVAPSTHTSPAAGDTQAVTITASDSSCTWTAFSPVAWATPAPTSGSGSGSVTITTAVNPSAGRSATLTIAGHGYSEVQNSTNLGPAIYPRTTGKPKFIGKAHTQ